MYIKHTLIKKTNKQKKPKSQRGREEVKEEGGQDGRKTPDSGKYPHSASYGNEVLGPFNNQLCFSKREELLDGFWWFVFVSCLLQPPRENPLQVHQQPKDRACQNLLMIPRAELKGPTLTRSAVWEHRSKTSGEPSFCRVRPPSIF